jgi:oligopeptide/dipeptide ABC transporter ATP-binding protein
MMESLLEVVNLATFFFSSYGVVKAVDDVTLSLKKRETLALVGESGCGKTVVSLSIMRLVSAPPGKIVSGKMIFKGRDLMNLTESEIRKIRGKEISMIFQEPIVSLNPVFTIGDQLIEVIKLHLGKNRRESIDLAVHLLELVKIPNPERRLTEYPHQLSGGLRQRIMIAMALSCNPDLLIADEPTTALDVTIQAQILELLQSLKELFGLSVLFITHDFGILAQIAQKVVVMYMGKVVERANVIDIFTNPLHPYTKGLLSSIPFNKKDKKSRLETLGGALPDVYNLPLGCYFEPRCKYRMAICMDKFPGEFTADNGHHVSCYLYK